MSFRLQRSALCLCLALFIALPCLGQNAENRVEPGTLRAQMRDGGLPVFDGSGYRVFFDRGTGQLRRPTREEIQRYGLTFAELYDAGGKGLVVHQAASGMLSIALSADYLDYAMATFRPDGQLVHSCVRGEQPARFLLTASNSCAPAAEEK
jgi:hypothetical protein